MQKRRVFITQAASISSLGMGFNAIHSGLKRTPQPEQRKDYDFHQLDSSVPVFAVRDFDPVAILGKKGLRTKDHATKLLLGTFENELKELMEGFDEQQRPGICVGTTFGSVQSIGDFLSDSIVNGVTNVNPQLFANTVINSPIGNANIRFTARNLSTTISTGFNAGIDALIYSCDYIKRGYIDRIVAGGLEEISYYTLLGFERSGLLSSSGAARPFALDCDGVVMGEGCALFVLESEDAMLARGAKPVAEIVGTASGFDPVAAQQGVPDDSCGRMVISESLSEAKIHAHDIDFIASGASGNNRSDSFETAAISSVFSAETPVTAYKAHLGECYGATGALISACALSDMKNSCISGSGATPYPTMNGVQLLFSDIQKRCNHALITSFSCEGNCSAVVIKNCD